MKPPPIRYARPESIDEAVELLAEHEDARCLAGGQSLMPILNLRLVDAAALVDLGGVPALDFIRRENGTLAIGAMTRHRAVESSALVRDGEPLLARVAGEIGHLAIRSRGTIGGSLAHADPAAEWPLVAVALDAQLALRSSSGTRTVAATDFFVGPLTTTLGRGEILTEVRFPVAPAGSSFGFAELCRRPGDFAIVAVACRVVVERDVCCSASLAVAGAHPTPLRIRQINSILCGSRGDSQALWAAADAASRAVDPGTDLHASAAYRRRMTAVLARRALEQAFERAEEA